MDESGSPGPDWIGFIRAARTSQEQNLEAVSDLPGGQVNSTTHFSKLSSPRFDTSLNVCLIFFNLKIFYRVLREIPAGEELTVWYSNALAQWYDIPTTATPTHDEKGIIIIIMLITCA